MASNPTRLKVKLLRGIILEGATQPKGSDQTYGKAGDIVELDAWMAHYLVTAEAAEFVAKTK